MGAHICAICQLGTHYTIAKDGSLKNGHNGQINAWILIIYTLGNA